MTFIPIPGITLTRTQQVIHLQSDAPLTVLSSAVVGGDLATTRHILNMHVHDNYNNDTPATDLTALANSLGINEPFVGLMTAAKLERAQVVCKEEAGVTVAAILTVGLTLPTAAGVTESAVQLNQPGTINTILVINANLTPAARANAIITATEAKTLALIEAGVRTPEGGLATGTGTDSIVITTTQRGPLCEYAGPVAPVGALLARAVRTAMQNAFVLRSLFNRPLA
jgi:iron complex transport system ATP-binding protein